MEIVSIEKKTFEMMVASFNALSEKVAALRRKSDGGRLERWLTGEEVCGQLRISPRTLQTLRDKRLIGYSQDRKSTRLNSSHCRLVHRHFAAFSPWQQCTES